MLPDQWSMREYLVYLKLTVATCIENPSTSYSWKKSVPLCVQASGRNTWKVAYCCPVIHRFTLGAEVMQHDHGHYYSTSFFYQPLSARGWTSAFLLAVHRMCGVIEGRLSHFLPRWLRTGWRSAISQGKIPWNTLPWLGIEPVPRRTDSEIHSVSQWAIVADFVMHCYKNKVY